MNTEKMIHDTVIEKRRLGMSLRAIARTYGNRIFAADISRISQGKFPAGIAKRRQLGLGPKCPTCFQVVHVRRPRPPRWVELAADHLSELRKKVENG